MVFVFPSYKLFRVSSFSPIEIHPLRISIWENGEIFTERNELILNSIEILACINRYWKDDHWTSIISNNRLLFLIPSKLKTNLSLNFPIILAGNSFILIIMIWCKNVHRHLPCIFDSRQFEFECERLRNSHFPFDYLQLCSLIFELRHKNTQQWILDSRLITCLDFKLNARIARECVQSGGMCSRSRVVLSSNFITFFSNWIQTSNSRENKQKQRWKCQKQ